MQKDKTYITHLAGRARLRDRAAFEKLVAHFSPRLFAHAFRLLGHREEAKDAVQGAWAEITRSLPKLRDDAAFMVWAYRITSRQCARQIDRLKSVQTATIGLLYIEEMSLREVDLAMDVPDGTVKSRLSQARNQLKSHLKGYENDKY